MTTTTAALDLQVGHRVNPVVTWGNQRRLQCPACRRYMRTEPNPLGDKAISACGATFRQVGNSDDFIVVTLP